MSGTTSSDPFVTDPSSSSGTESSGDPNPPKKDVVTYETHQRLLDQKKKAQAELETLRAEKAEREKKELEDKGEYQKLLQLQREEAEKAKQELQTLRQKEVTRTKLASILEAVDGDIDSKFYGLIDYDKVVINPDTGEVDQMSVTKVVTDLRKSFPEIIKGKNAHHLPSHAPGSAAPGTIKRSEWLNLSSAEMKKWSLNQIID